MDRYEFTKVVSSKEGFPVYSTTYYPEIPIEDDDVFIFTVFGDRLDTLAFKAYGDVTMWWIIAKANGIRGKMALKPGTPLRIPSDIKEILQKIEDLNRSQ